MAVLTVRRPSHNKRELLLQGKWLPVGTEIDTRDFPQVSNIPGKWAQLVRLGILHDAHLTDPELVREVAAQRDEFGSAQLVPSRMDSFVPIDRDLRGNPALDEEDIARLDKPIGLVCGDCGFQATSDHGLKIHVGRKHASN